MNSFFAKNRIIPPLIFFIIGILLKDYIEYEWEIILFLAVITGLASLSKHNLKPLLFIPIGLLFVADRPLTENHISNFSGKKLNVEGVLFKPPENRIGNSRLYIDVENVFIDSTKVPAKGKIIITVGENTYGLYRGYRIRVLNTNLREFRNFKNPGNFNINKYYKRKDIYLKGYIPDKSNIISFGGSEYSNLFLVYIDKIRDSFGNHIRKTVSYPSSEIYTALTIGDRKSIPEDLKYKFSNLGIAHLLAISGLHVGAIALIFYLLIDWLLKRSEYLLLKYQVPRISAAITILPVLLYMMVAGFAIPVVRATIMAVIYLLSIVFSRSHYKLNTLGIAAFIILLIEPTSIYDLSFHLSFSAVLGILLVNNYYPFSFSSLIHKLETSLKATLAATIFTLPLIVNTFGIMPLISVPSNMFFIPLVEFIIVPLGLLSFILFEIYASLSVPLIIINGVFIKALLSSVNYISDISFSALTVPYLNKLNILLFYLSICIFFIKIHKNKLIYILVPIT